MKVNYLNNLDKPKGSGLHLSSALSLLLLASIGKYYSNDFLIYLSLGGFGLIVLYQMFFVLFCEASIFFEDTQITIKHDKEIKNYDWKEIEKIKIEYPKEYSSQAFSISVLLILEFSENKSPIILIIESYKFKSVEKRYKSLVNEIKRVKPTAEILLFDKPYAV